MKGVDDLLVTVPVDTVSLLSILPVCREGKPRTDQIL